VYFSAQKQYLLPAPKCRAGSVSAVIRGGSALACFAWSRHCGVRNIAISVHVFVCLSICLSVRLSVRLPDRISKPHEGDSKYRPVNTHGLGPSLCLFLTVFFKIQKKRFLISCTRTLQHASSARCGPTYERRPTATRRQIAHYTRSCMLPLHTLTQSLTTSYVIT